MLKKFIKNNIFHIDKKQISLAQKQHIRMISEGSCDTEDWSNNTENSALPSQEYITL